MSSAATHAQGGQATASAADRRRGRSNVAGLRLDRSQATPCGTTSRGIWCARAVVQPLRSPAAPQRHQPLHEPQRRRHLVRGDVARGCLELQHALPGGVALHAFVGQRRAGDVATKLFQRLAVVRRAAHSGVQAETLHVGAQGLFELRLPRHHAQARPAAGLTRRVTQWANLRQCAIEVARAQHGFRNRIAACGFRLISQHG